MNIENMFDKPDVKQLVHAFSLWMTRRISKLLLTDICTPREICDLSQRLQVARYPGRGRVPMSRFRRALGASSHHGEPWTKDSTASTGLSAKILIAGGYESGRAVKRLRKTASSGRAI